MILYINSKPQEVPDTASTIGKVIDYLRISRQGTGIGLNNRLVPSVEWDKTPVRNEDRLMIISAAFGG